jgi:hypothetical protein
MRGSEHAPPIDDLLMPRRDWREFDPVLRKEMEDEKEFKRFQAILTPDI